MDAARPTKPKPKSLFHCRDRKTGEVLQGIAYTDGSQAVGIDIWRLLYKMDYPSFPIKTYPSRGDLVIDLQLINKPKGYYIEPIGDTYNRKTNY